MINKKDLESFARDAARTNKSEKDFTNFRAVLTKVTVEGALNAELDDHLCYDKHEQSSSSNSLNGATRKTANLSPTHHGIGKWTLSLSWLKSTKPALLRWMAMSPLPLVPSTLSPSQ
jgi:hypothetical protein